MVLGNIEAVRTVMNLSSNHPACVFAFSLLFILTTTLPADAQQVSTGVGQHSVSQRFGESYQLGWTYQRPGLFAQFNGGAPPPYGYVAGNPGFQSWIAAGPVQLGFSAGQYTSLQSSSFTPMLTTTNGMPGSLFIGRATPFVTGVVSVTGPTGGFMNLGPANTVAGRVARGELQLRPREEQPHPEPVGLPPAPAPETLPPAPRPARAALSTAAELLAKGDAAQAEGKTALAKVYYQLAAARTDEPASLEAVERLGK